MALVQGIDIFLPYRYIIYLKCSDLGVPPGAREETIQEVFSKLAATMARGNHQVCDDWNEKQIKGYLRQATRNIVAGGAEYASSQKRDYERYGGQVIEDITPGGRWNPSSVGHIDLIKKINKRLTVKEKKVLFHKLKGMSNNEIAEEIGLASRTIRNHMIHIRRKIRAIVGGNSN